MAERRSWIAASSWKQPSAQFFLEIGSNFLGFRSSLWELFAKRVWTTILPSSLSQHQKQMLPSASPSPPVGPTPTTITNGFTFRSKSDQLLYLLYILYCTLTPGTGTICWSKLDSALLSSAPNCEDFSQKTRKLQSVSPSVAPDVCSRVAVPSINISVVHINDHRMDFVNKGNL